MGRVLWRGVDGEQLERLVGAQFPNRVQVTRRNRHHAAWLDVILGALHCDAGGAFDDEKELCCLGVPFLGNVFTAQQCH